MNAALSVLWLPLGSASSFLFLSCHGSSWSDTIKFPFLFLFFLLKFLPEDMFTDFREEGGEREKGERERNDDQVLSIRA